jgi:hypothetical protein
MNRLTHNRLAEQAVLQALISQGDGQWRTAVEFAAVLGLNWRVTARALQRPHAAGSIPRREVVMTDANYRKRVRKEYKYQPPIAAPLLKLHPFDPSQYKILGVRVIRRL